MYKSISKVCKRANTDILRDKCDVYGSFLKLGKRVSIDIYI